MATNISFEDTTATGLITKAILDLHSATFSDEDVDYKPLYYFLFNGITKVLDTLNGKPVHKETVEALKKLQCDSEDLFMEQAENNDKVIPITKSRS